MAQRAAGTAIDHDGGANLNATVGHLGGYGRGGRLVPQSALDVYLQGLGASREEIRSINYSINELVNKAQIKQENTSDKIDLLKKVEIKFHELKELRQVFDFFDSGALLEHEKNYKRAEKERVTGQIQEKNKMAEEQRQKKLEQKIEDKKNMVVAKQIRNAQRSEKPNKARKKQKSKEMPEDLVLMRRYLGIVPEDWDMQATAQDADAGQRADAAK